MAEARRAVAASAVAIVAVLKTFFLFLILYILVLLHYKDRGLLLAVLLAVPCCFQSNELL